MIQNLIKYLRGEKLLIRPAINFSSPILFTVFFFHNNTYLNNNTGTLTADSNNKYSICSNLTKIVRLLDGLLQVTSSPQKILIVLESLSEY